MLETIRCERHDGVASVTLDRPTSLNAMNDTMEAEIAQVFDELSTDDTVRAIVFHGAGERAFCAGADMKEETTHSHDQFGEFYNQNHGEFFDAISDCPKPIICAVNGWAVGAGCQMPLCCDVIYASESATFKLPQVSLGIMPAYAGAVRLSQFIGRGKAAEMALLGETIDAREAHEFGLVQRVLSDNDTLLDYAMEQAVKLAEQPPMSVAMAKESIKTGLDEPISRAKEADTYRFFSLVTTEDRKSQHESVHKELDSDQSE